MKPDYVTTISINNNKTKLEYNDFYLAIITLLQHLSMQIWMHILLYLNSII